MRTILFFDLPTKTIENQRNYRKFIKFIKKLGFYMLQESVYVKMSLDNQKSAATVEKIRKFVPSSGSIISITVTEKQFNCMDILLGVTFTDVECSDSRVVEL